MPCPAKGSILPHHGVHIGSRFLLDHVQCWGLLLRCLCYPQPPPATSPRFPTVSLDLGVQSPLSVSSPLSPQFVFSSPMLACVSFEVRGARLEHSQLPHSAPTSSPWSSGAGSRLACSPSLATCLKKTKVPKGNPMFPVQLDQEEESKLSFLDAPLFCHRCCLAVLGFHCWVGFL